MTDYEKAYKDLQTLYVQWLSATVSTANEPLEELLYDISLVIEGNYPFADNKDFTKNPKSKIYKYTLPVKGGYQEVELPQYAHIVAVEAHPEVGNVINFWAQFDEEDEANKETHTFLTVGTGQRFSNAYHHGTVLDGHYVWHLLEVRG